MADSRAAQVLFHGARFSAPPALTDTSVLSFVDHVGTPSLSLTVAQERLSGGAPALTVYVDEQQRAAQKAVPGYAMVARTERSVGGAAALLVEGSAPSPGKKRRVLQLYVLDAPHERVFVVTATAAEAEVARARAVVEHVATGFTLEGSK
ncbi:MAG: DcrB-related protein [Deltaproteobacteria bacterium]|nr:DcrB-related protein [Deltaproteobacteria bacterium]